MDEDSLIGTREAIAILGVHRSSIPLFVKDGRLVPVGKIGGAFVFRRVDVERLRDERASGDESR